MTILLTAAITFTPMPNGCLDAQLDLNDLAHEHWSRGVRLDVLDLLTELRRCASSTVEAAESPPPSPVQQPVDPVSVPGSGVERWRGLVSEHFNTEDVDTALCLMGYESAGDPGAINPSSGARGLMQVMPDWAPIYGYAVDDLLDPSVNLAVAAALRYATWGGWDQWSPYQRGLCR